MLPIGWGQGRKLAMADYALSGFQPFRMLTFYIKDLLLPNAKKIISPRCICPCF